MKSTFDIKVFGDAMAIVTYYAGHPPQGPQESTAARDAFDAILKVDLGEIENWWGDHTGMPPEYWRKTLVSDMHVVIHARRVGEPGWLLAYNRLKERIAFLRDLNESVRLGHVRPTLDELAAEKLIRILPSQWSRIEDELTATERTALKRLVEVGLAEVRTDYLLTWDGHPNDATQISQFYHLRGLLWWQSGPLRAIHDAVVERAASDFANPPNMLATGQIWYDFRLTASGDRARRDLGYCPNKLDMRLTSICVDGVSLMERPIRVQ